MLKLNCLTRLSEPFSIHNQAQSWHTLQLAGPSQSRLESLAQKANEGRLTVEEAQEYDRFIELGAIIATLRLKAERQMQVVRV